MKGLELSRRYYEKCGLPMIKEQFPELLDKLAIGLTGSGSECYGYDDEISQDHDFEPGFCVFLPGIDVVDEKTEFDLMRAYNKLPSEFEGYHKSILNPVGGNRHGVFRAKEYYLEKTGTDDGLLTAQQWLITPDYVLAEAVNGEIFYDGYGLVTEIRNNLKAIPEDILKKRIAGNLVIMAQSGQYNYSRCLKRGDNGAAQMALHEFVNAAIKCAFLLNDKFSPYYKWCFRGLRELERLSVLAEILEYLINNGNSEAEAAAKSDMIYTVAELFNDEIIRKGYVTARNNDLEKLAYSVNNTIKDNDIRNLDIMIAV